MYDPNAYDPYGNENQGDSNGGAGQYIDLIKSKLPTIILLAVVLGAIYVNYDFFIGSFHTLTVSLVDLEGKPLTTGTIQVFDGDKSIPPVPGSDNEFRLRGPTLFSSGEYEITVNSGAFEPEKRSATITADKPEKIEMTKKNFVTATFQSAFPANLYGGQSANVNLELNNTASQSTIIEPVLEGGLASNGITLQFGTDNHLQAIGKTKTQYEITITAVSTYSPKPTTGETIKGKIRIKGTKDYFKSVDGKDEFSVKLMPKPDIKLEPTGPQTLEAGKSTDRISIKIDNTKNKYDLTNAELSVEVVRAEPTNATGEEASTEDIQNHWIRFVELSNDPDTPPAQLLLEKINSASNVTKQLSVDVPIDAKAQTIYMVAHLELPGGIQMEKEFSMKITKEASSNVTATLDTKTVTFRRTETVPKYPKLTISNLNNFPVQNVAFQISNSTTCLPDFLQVLEGNTYVNGSIGTLSKKGSAGDKAVIVFQATVPANAPVASTFCDISVSYLDPISQDSFIELTPQQLEIRITG